MTTGRSGRRSFLLVGGSAGIAVGLLDGRALAQPEMKPILASSAGTIHGEVVGEISDLVAKTGLVTANGLDELISHLARQKILNDEQRKILQSLGRLLFSKEAPKVILERIRKLNDASKAKAEDLATVVTSIALDSVNWIIKHQKAIQIAAADVVGAMSGIAAAAKLGPNPMLLFVGAICGAAAASLKAAE